MVGSGSDSGAPAWGLGGHAGGPGSSPWPGAVDPEVDLVERCRRGDRGARGERPEDGAASWPRSCRSVMASTPPGGSPPRATWSSRGPSPASRPVVVRARTASRRGHGLPFSGGVALGGGHRRPAPWRRPIRRGLRAGAGVGPDGDPGPGRGDLECGRPRSPRRPPRPPDDAGRLGRPNGGLSWPASSADSPPRRTLTPCSGSSRSCPSTGMSSWWGRGEGAGEDRPGADEVACPRANRTGSTWSGADTVRRATCSGPSIRLVVPSRYESFGLTLAEGLWAGVPVVATRSGLAKLVPGARPRGPRGSRRPVELADAVARRPSGPRPGPDFARVERGPVRFAREPKLGLETASAPRLDRPA